MLHDGCKGRHWQVPAAKVKLNQKNHNSFTISHPQVNQLPPRRATWSDSPQRERIWQVFGAQSAKINPLFLVG
jgi:hypothetical protein